MNEWTYWLYQVEEESPNRWYPVYQIECFPKHFREMLTLVQQRHSVSAHLPSIRIRRAPLMNVKLGVYRFNGHDLVEHI